MSVNSKVSLDSRDGTYTPCPLIDDLKTVNCGLYILKFPPIDNIFIRNFFSLNTKTCWFFNEQIEVSLKFRTKVNNNLSL